MIDPTRRSMRRRRWVRAGLMAFGLVVCLALDMPIRAATASHGVHFSHTDLAQFLRTGGYIPLWLVVAAAVAFEDCRRLGKWSIRTAKRGLTLAAAVVLGGLLAETLKAIFRRERVNASSGWYVFRSVWDRPFDTGGLSMPSSHALVAFSAAFTLGHFYRGARPVLIAFAIGTAASRVYSNAHLLSDVYVSLLLGWGVSRALAGSRSIVALPATKLGSVDESLDVAVAS